ncbi:MAG: hypothetical protein J6N72_00630 [Psychrobacter sp.]|nr:hypothetical protein [Psychrobacter sp.]
MQNNKITAITLEKTSTHDELHLDPKSPLFFEYHNQNKIAATRAKKEYFLAILIAGGVQLLSATTSIFDMVDRQLNFFVIGFAVLAFGLGLTLSMTFLIKEFMKASKKQSEAITRIKEHKRSLL